MKELFPALPPYEFSWRSIQIEPTPSSGERITLGTILKGADQVLIAAKLIPDSRLKVFYGESFGKRISEALNICIKSAESFYSSHQLSHSWTPPLEGFFQGELKTSFAENLEDGLTVAAMYCSSYSLSHELEKMDEDIKTSLSTPEAWKQNITEAVLARRSDLSKHFKMSISIRGSGGVPISYGFLTDKYAAHFDAVSNVQGIHKALVRAQSKLWQLDRLRDEQTLFRPDVCELLFKIPITENDQDNVNFLEFTDELRYEAARREIKLFTSNSALEAAKHLIQIAA
jgi:hypothetical protein